MHKARPLTQLRILTVKAGWKAKARCAARGVETGLRSCWMLLLGAALVCAAAHAAAPKAGAAAGDTARQGNPADYVGAEVCASCHEAEAKGFATNPHSKMVLMHGNNGVTCENCHGPGRAHVEGGGDVTKIFNPGKGSAKQVDSTCLNCHAGAHPDFERSPHAKAGVGCTSCHSIHKSEERAELLKAPQPTLCFQCHTDAKASFNMPFHHPVNEGLVKCSDCHDVHGTFEKSNLRSRNDSNLVCTKCHTEVRGPFVYEHTPIKAEGCMGCHSPHGSQNARLLNMPSINLLCNQCHSPVAAATVHGMNAGSSELTPCTDCHTYIHGSNLNVAFLR
jgi:DmsE family decaheme c-type cytochrome